jgi:hypothetical protein
MTPDQLAAAKGKARTNNDLHRLAMAANGLGVTRVERERAQGELERAVGKRRTTQLKETALQRAGARPKGLGRFFS